MPDDDRHSIELPRLFNAAHQAKHLLRVLSNENRLLLMCQLSKGERSVGELETLLGIRQPTLSQQLGILREEKMVATRRSGKQIFYRVDNEHALQLMRALHDMFSPEPASRPISEPTSETPGESA
ncbi:MAG: metalloregulator ArsR/SmtB family transcription factor [Brachymonas sp.]|nr:metalloregulator ArsR/SmtB family transcription factor [Brachymonas sp.]